MRSIIRGINKYQILLWIFIITYILYFSFFTILRYRTLYASYFDLGIMHQTVYNTYKALTTWDTSRFLELTNPLGSDQIKRIAIHNDMLLALLAPFYLIYAGPETLLVIQTIVTALGAYAVYKIAGHVLKKTRGSMLLALVFAFSYLLYSPLQRANIFEFHAVTLATTFLLFMFYFWLVKRYKLSIIFFILSLLAKEQVTLSTLFFGLYTLFFEEKKKNSRFSWTIIIASVIWFIASLTILIPYFRGARHFALSYYGDFGETPIGVIIGILRHPYNIAKYIFHIDTLRYFLFLLGPLAFLPVLSFTQLAIAAPEFAINLLSNNWHMRNIIFHYTAVITPFAFISAIYGARKKNKQLLIVVLLLVFTLLFSYLKGPLPFTREQEIHPLKYPQKEVQEVIFWAKTLKDENLKISSTGQLAPFFTGRRYYYVFSKYYDMADYIVLRTNEIFNYPEKKTLIPIYEGLKKDRRYEIIYKNGVLEVYKKLPKS